MSVSGASLVPKVGRRSICGRLVAPTGYIFTTEGIIRDTNLSYVLMIFIRKTWQGNLVRLRLLESRTFLKGVIPKKGERKEKAKISEYQKESFTPFTYRYSNGRLGHFWLPNTRWRIALEGGWLGITLLGLSG